MKQIPKKSRQAVQDELRAAANAVQDAVIAASEAMKIQPRTAEADAATAKAVAEMDRAVDAEADAFDRLCAFPTDSELDRFNKQVPGGSTGAPPSSSPELR